jgi:putative resolvase
MDVKTTKGKYIPINQAVQATGLSIQTIRKLGDSKEIQCYKTPSGHRRFNKQDLEKFCGLTPPGTEVSTPTKANYIYARVSSKKQLDDLSRQIEYLQTRRPEYSSYTTISDIASGINFKRKGLQTILDSCLQGTIGEVIVAHRDRLSRFGFDLINLLVDKSGGKITVLDDEKDKSSEQELAEDLLSIIHIFSCRQMGKRAYTAKRTQKHENTVEVEGESEGDN